MVKFTSTLDVIAATLSAAFAKIAARRRRTGDHRAERMAAFESASQPLARLMAGGTCSTRELSARHKKRTLGVPHPRFSFQRSLNMVGLEFSEWLRRCARRARGRYEKRFASPMASIRCRTTRRQARRRPDRSIRVRLHPLDQRDRHGSEMQSGAQRRAVRIRSLGLRLQLGAQSEHAVFQVRSLNIRGSRSL